jgi:maltooligosyltrehalose trehalohydrolase
MRGGGHWQLARGATVVDGGCRFSVWAPRAERVGVRLGPGPRAVEMPLERRADGVHEATVRDCGPGTDYVYRIEGHDRPDPVSRHQAGGVHGPSRIVDPRAFRWSDGGWRGREMADLVLYELHVGTFTGAGTFDAIVAHLPELRGLGITAIELMPVAEFPGGRNWGYDGVSPYAPQSTYGGPEGLRRLVDAAHRANLAVILDVVYNHLGPEGNYLGEFGPYFTDFYKTPWGQALNFDGPDSDEVRRYFVDNALYWVTEFHLDGLRLDAVHAIYDFGARHILEEIAAAVHEEARRLERRVLVIAESDLNDPRLVRAPERGGYGLDGQWTDDFHHAVHTALTREQGGYYGDFDGAPSIAKALRDRFVYDGRHSAFRRRRHGAPAGDVAAERFVVCVQNHDQIGNRARGERLAALVSPARQRLAAALLLLSPYVPLLFMGEEYGETNPFLYFISHTDPALIAAVRDGRREEFRSFAWAGEVPDPQAEETFARCRLDRTRTTAPGHREILALYGDLLRTRHEEASLRPGTPPVVTDDPGASWIALAYEGPGPRLLAAFNLAEGERTVVSTTSPGAAGRTWRRRLSTNDRAYGGDGAGPPATLAGSPLRVPVPPLAAVLYREETT